MRYIKFLVLCVCLSACDKDGPKTVIPKEVVEGHLKGYSSEEISLIQQDLANISDLSFRDKKPDSQPTYLATAGGPGALKSTVLETILYEDPAYENFVYADPDPRGLRLMINTYITKGLSFHAIKVADSFKQSQIDAYNYWRGGSNYIASTIINKAFGKKYNIAHGTTSTSPLVEKLYQTLKKHGYKIELALCYGANDMRMKTIEYRTKTQANYQVTPEDAVTKGMMFPQRFPVYFKYADRLRLFWADDLTRGAYEVAQIENGQVKIIDQCGFDKFVAQYELDRKNCDNALQDWKTVLDLNSHNS